MCVYTHVAPTSKMMESVEVKGLQERGRDFRPGRKRQSAYACVCRGKGGLE